MLSTDQSHLRKYLATLGVAVVAGVVSISALVFRLNDVLLVKESDLAQLTPGARETIVRRQHFAEVATTALPWFLVLGVVAGLILTGFGFYGWSKRQRVADRLENVALGEAEHRFEQMTKPERDRRLKDEAKRVEREAPSHPDTASQRREAIERLATLEASLGDKLRALFGEVRSGVRMVGPPRTVEVDYLAVADDGTNHVFELKYAANRAGMLKRIQEGRAQVREFLSVIGFGVRGYVVAVLPDGVADMVRPSWPNLAASIAPATLVIVGEAEFVQMSAEEFGRRIGFVPS